MAACDKSVILLNDAFGEARPRGGVIGSSASDGTLRRGADVESIISIDHDALRLEPLITPGWTRAGLVYGPYSRMNGLAFATFLLNGHNAAQNGPLGERLRGRLKRWTLSNISARQSKLSIGLGVAASMVRRVLRPRKGILRQLAWWYALSRASDPIHKDSLAIGWFNSEIPAEPFSGGHALGMRTMDGENGELRAHTNAAMIPVVAGVQNIPLYCVVVLRKVGAAYYAGSLPDSKGFASYGRLRPLAIDPTPGAERLYAGLYQGVMGEIGFRSNTRVYGMRVAYLPTFDKWYGSAHAADMLTGDGDFDVAAERGGRWQVYRGALVRSARGTTSSGDGLAILTPDQPSGLLHAFVEREGEQAAGVVWRALDSRNYWHLSLDGRGCYLSLVNDGVRTAIAVDHKQVPRLHGVSALQILDDGRSMRCFLDGRLLFGAAVADERLSTASGVGISTSGLVYLRSFEAHPRSIDLPPSLDLGAPWCRVGSTLVAHDPLTGTEQPLAGSVACGVGSYWTRTHGQGQFDRGTHGTRVVADVSQPNPGRTLYTVDWSHPEFADLEVALTPPGSERGQGHRGRGGLVCWQDTGNYLVVSIWLDDAFGGAASVSSFFQLGGYEDIYDAVWTNVGRRIHWGVPFKMRLQFDGMRYRVCVNGEPVLYRALTDVYPNAARWLIRRVGLAANWEWGDDTGSLFRDFIARSG